MGPLSPLVLFHSLLGTVLLALGFLALRARKSRRSGHPALGEAYFWTLAVALGSGMLVGAQHPGLSVFEIATPPTFLLGLLGYAAVKRKPAGWLGQPWMFWHILGQGGSYIGVVTATSFQVVPRLIEYALPAPVRPPAEALVVVLFAAPTLVGSLLIARAQRRWVRRPPASEPAEVHPA